MARTLDSLLVVDVESTCWRGDTPEGERSEIIEIGICPVHLDDLHPGSATSMLVKPEFSTVSDFCTSLTSITQKDLVNGVLFRSACKVLLNDFQSSYRVWGSWGDYDRRQFEKQCKEQHIRYPFGPTHLNIKNLFALQMGLKKEVGMDKALELLGFGLEGRHHRGIDDAQNIAKILCHLLKESRRRV